MKYRIVRAAKRSPTIAPKKRILRLSATQTLSRMARNPTEAIDFSRLFEISDLPEIPRKHAPHPLWTAIRAFLLAVCVRIAGLVRRSLAHLREKWERLRARIQQCRKKRRARKRTERLYFLAGALSASLSVSLLFALTVSFCLFGTYGGLYREVTVPALVGLPYEEETLEDALFSYAVDYAVNPNVAPGTVISQSPPAGVTRRVWGRGKPCTVILTVSCAPSREPLAELVGLSRRDAVLLLSNQGLCYELQKAYSDTAPIGTVLSQSVAAGTRLPAGKTVVLTLSAGPLKLLTTVPTLEGLSEGQATSLLLSAGLSVGNVTYLPSDRPIGTVLSQDLPPAALVEQGRAVSLTVSAGNSYADARIPSLYGLTLTEATARLRAFGLVPGTVHSCVGEAEGRTVVAQFPLPDTPITSATVSVDVYLG